MANEFIIKNGYFSQGSSNITGSLTVTAGITGSLFGTASWAQNATSASFLTSNTNAFIQGGNSFGTTALLGTNDTQNLQFETNGLVRMLISSSGQVAFGSSTPLILSGGLFEGVSPFMEVQTGITGGAYNEAVILRHAATNSTAATRSLGLLMKLSIEAMPNEAPKMGGMILRSTSVFSNSPALHFVIGNTETMTISNAGNVGIGTITPTQKLTVAGGSILLDNSTALKHKNASGTELDMVTLNAGNSLFLGSGQRDIYFRTGNNNIVYVTSSAVGIGTTTPNATLDVNGNTIITGSLTVTNNLTILGSASIQYITSSQLNIFDNIISVNTNTPAIRFGGIAVNDSGSTPIRSGSLLFDSQNNQWIFVHQNTAGGATTSSVLLMGPQTFNNVGNETALTTNRLPKGAGVDLGEHLTDSNISDTGTQVSINSNTAITGSLTVIGNTYITGGLITYYDFSEITPGVYLPVLDTVNDKIYRNDSAVNTRLSISYGVTRSLYDNQFTQQKSLDWANRNLVNSSGSTVLDWNTGITITGSAQITGSLGVTGSLSVSEYDASIGLYTVLDTSNKTLQTVWPDTSVGAAISWGSGYLATYDTGRNQDYISVDWSNRNLNTIATSGVAIPKTSVDWGNRYLRYSNTGFSTPQISVNWGAGTLNDISGSTALQWNTPGILTVTGSLRVTGSLSVNGNVQLGFETTASGLFSHAEGSLTEASGTFSHAEGRQTNAYGSGSHAEGNQTFASGDYSHAEGSRTIASGFASHAEGFFTVASGSYQHVQGQYNISSSAQSAFIVGNGTGNAARSNLIFASGSRVEITGSLSVTSLGNNTGSFVTINGNNTLNSRTAAQVCVDINYYGLTYAMQNGYY